MFTLICNKDGWVLEVLEGEHPNGIIVESIPEPPEIEAHQNSELFIDPDTKEMWYELEE